MAFLQLMLNGRYVSNLLHGEYDPFPPTFFFFFPFFGGGGELGDFWSSSYKGQFLIWESLSLFREKGHKLLRYLGTFKDIYPKSLHS